MKISHVTPPIFLSLSPSGTLGKLCGRDTDELGPTARSVLNQKTDPIATLENAKAQQRKNNPQRQAIKEYA